MYKLDARGMPCKHEIIRPTSKATPGTGENSSSNSAVDSTGNADIQRNISARSEPQWVKPGIVEPPPKVSNNKEKKRVSRTYGSRARSRTDFFLRIPNVFPYHDVYDPTFSSSRRARTNAGTLGRHLVVAPTEPRKRKAANVWAR